MGGHPEENGWLYRNWANYVDGFGDPEGKYWLGLKNIHCLTSRVECNELKVCLADFEGVKRFANYMYSVFSVGNAETKYRLNIDWWLHGHSR